MEFEPSAGHAAHALTHVYYETGDHSAGLTWIDGWIRAHGPRTTYRAHFSWHAALHELALDDAAAVRRRYLCELTPPAVSGARALVDSASLLWRSRMVGCWDDALPIEPVLETVTECWLETPATPFTALHAVVGLAAAGDLSGLDRLRQFALAHPDRAYHEVITAICDGFAAVVEQRPTEAITALSSVVDDLDGLGGSAAQREIVIETLVHALVESGDNAGASALLSERLDRRPSALDARRLKTLKS